MTTSKPVKSGIPRALRHELKRTALLEQLNAKADFPVIALLAPSGYGKTTTLAQLARQGSRAVAWVTLTEDEASTEVLAASVARAVALFVPGNALPAWNAIQSTSSVEGNARALAEDLNTSDANLIVVLDRTEHLGANAAKWLEAFVTNLAEGHQVMLAGYESTLLPMARWLARGEAWLIGPGELAFSGEEVTHFLLERERDVNAVDLHRSLEGWPAGIALVAAGAPSYLAPKDLVLERLDQLPKPLREDLAGLAVIEEWDEATPEALGIKLPRGWLRQVIGAGLPLSPLASGRSRAHTVLLEALETRLLERPSVHVQLHVRAGDLAERAGLKLLALKHFLAAKQTAQAVVVAESVSAELIVRRDFLLARQVLERFQPGILPTEMQVQLAVTLIETGNPDAGEAILNGLHSAGVQSAELYRVLASRKNLQGHFQEQLSLIDQAMVMPMTKQTQAHLLLLRSDGLEYMGEIKQSIASAQEAVSVAESSGDLATVAKAVTRLAGVLSTAYDLAGASGTIEERVQSEQHFHRALKLYESLGMERRKLDILNNLANQYCIWGQVEKALEMINQALNIEPDAADSVRAALLGTRGWILLTWGFASQAIQDFQVGLTLAAAHGMSRYQFNYNVWLCEAGCVAGDLTTAEYAFGQAKATLPNNSQMHQSWFSFLQGLWAFSKSDNVAMLQAWESVRTDDLGYIYHARMLLYRAELDRRKNTLQHEQIDFIFTLWAAKNNDAPLFTDARVLKTLFETCIQNGWYAARFQAALERNLEPVQKQTIIELHVATFGTTRVVINQTPIKLPLVKCAELLAWLILNGPSTRNAIVNALWDGSRRKADVEHARIIIRRLRAALSEHPDVTFNPLEFDGTRYGLNTAFEITCDAKTVLDSSSSASIEPSVLEHLNVYSGSFLEGCDTDWVQEMTSQLTDAAINSFVTLGRQYEITHSEQALEVYQRAIKLDPLAANAYEGIVRVQSQMGKTAAVQQTQAMLEQSEKRNLIN
jgi:LuxR family transcriptional regulator, maltose regulon positive regulatory protein